MTTAPVPMHPVTSTATLTPDQFQTLAFSKTLNNHIGVIQSFICHDNLTRGPALPL
jgi:hypothetical protein